MAENVPDFQIEGVKIFVVNLYHSQEKLLLPTYENLTLFSKKNFI